MLFKVINNDKVKILVENSEIDKTFLYNLNTNNEVAKDTLAYLLISIYNETGISFLNSKVYIEIIEGTTNTYYIIITRLKSQDNDDFIIAEPLQEDDMYIYHIKNIENLFDASKIIDIDFIQKDQLLEYKDKLYFLIYFKNQYLQNEQLRLGISKLDNLFTRCKSKLVADAILNEWGTVIDINVLQKIKTS